MELKIGDIVTYGFRKFKIIPKISDTSCEKMCDLRNICSNITRERREEMIGECFSFLRQDNTDVVFIEIDD